MVATRQHNQISSELGSSQLIAVSSLHFLRAVRAYKPAHIKQAARFIETFGIRIPILVDAQRNVIEGVIWALAAQFLELPEIPALFVEGLSSEQLNAYRIGLQRIPELGGWDETALGELFQDWDIPSLGFDLEITGFTTPEIDAFIGKLDQTDSTASDEPELERSEAAVSSPGDMWRLGAHRIICANSVDPESFHALMGHEKASVIITDPPYNVAIDGHAGGKGSIHHREFAMASGEMSEAEFTTFLATIVQLMIQFSKKGSLHYLFMDWRHAYELLGVGRQYYSELKNIITWVKSNAGMGSFYRSQHEFIFLFKNGDAPHRNNVQLGRHGRNRTNVWNYPGATSPEGRTTEEGHLLGMHPTVKPVQMIADAILDSSARGEIVLDPFLGSGSTLLAAERVGRRLYGIEFDPLYVDVAIRRWQRQTGEQAINLRTGRTFDETSTLGAQAPDFGQQSVIDQDAEEYHSNPAKVTPADITAAPQSNKGASDEKEQIS